jgi:hypothetical protein
MSSKKIRKKRIGGIDAPAYAKSAAATFQAALPRGALLLRPLCGWCWHKSLRRAAAQCVFRGFRPSLGAGSRRRWCQRQGLKPDPVPTHARAGRIASSSTSLVRTDAASLLASRPKSAAPVAGGGISGVSPLGDGPFLGVDRNSQTGRIHILKDRPRPFFLTPPRPTPGKLTPFPPLLILPKRRFRPENASVSRGQILFSKPDPVCFFSQQSPLRIPLGRPVQPQPRPRHRPRIPR